MKTKVVSIFWGLALILGGALFLAQNLGFVVNASPIFWIAAFAGLSALFFITYFMNGVQHWGWLFPASIFASTALTIGLSEAGVEGNIVAAPVLLSVAVPFLVAFLFDPAQRWWALIPAWVMGVITAIVLFADLIPGELVAAMILWSIALPFVVVFFLNQTRRWALIPAFVLGVVGVIPLLSVAMNGEILSAFILAFISLPFFVVLLFSRKNWWALIPGGIIASIALGLLFLGLNLPAVQKDNLMNGVMFLGWAITFGVLWLLRQTYPTAWAKFPAIVFGVISLFSLASGSTTQLLWPVLLVCAGVIILVFNLLPKRAQ